VRLGAHGKSPLEIAFFGSSLVSAYWNGAATYYRGLVRALHARGHGITFYEPDAFDRQAHRDIDDPPWARVVVYSAEDPGAPRRALAEARGADVIVKASGVGVFDELLEAAVPKAKRRGAKAIYWDVDAPATLARLRHDPSAPLRAALPCYDVVFTYGGGAPVVREYEAMGARRCFPIYNALDPETHFPVTPDPSWSADLALLANRLPDREGRVDEFFFKAARALPNHRFLLGGSGYGDKAMPPNVRYVGHVETALHNVFNSSSLSVLNVARDSMAASGFCPATRVFEAAGAGACIITDAWEGIDLFLEPGREVLLAKDGAEVARILSDLTPARARAIGALARRRVLLSDTYAERAREVEALIEELPSLSGEGAP
jgi:spore maturation protein CgeB